MPPKGGNTSLSDAEVKAAVDYMMARRSKQLGSESTIGVRVE